ncbi:MAG: ABC transporter ATP-binding protein [Spirochaetia bacterium]|nr:ABC transporter ATP-binding protein [Spirochaetia bacterium]
MSSVAEAIVEIKGLKKEYQGEGETVRVLDNLDMTVTSGSIVCVEGASGVGKSTLLHVIGTMDSAEGEVRVLGREVLGMSDGEKEKFRGRDLGFIFQHHYLLPDFTVLENVMMPLLIQGGTFPEAQAAARAMLENVGLSHRLTHFPTQISGGELARTGVARALVGGKKLILADEPTGNLDKRNSDHLAELIWKLQAELAFTLILVTHDRELAGRVPIRYRMHQGKLVRSD